MLPFFSTKDNGTPLSTQDAADILKKGVASWRMSQGICLFTAKNKNKFYVPCYNYFREAFERA